MINLGDRVSVELEEIPEHERQCTTGEVIGLSVRFPATPKFRRERVKIRFDKNYVKGEFRFSSGINELTMDRDDPGITLLKGD